MAANATMKEPLFSLAEKWGSFTAAVSYAICVGHRFPVYIILSQRFRQE